MWKIVKGEEIAPVDNPAALNKFNERSDKALSTIVLAVAPSLLYLLGDPEDPVEVWKALESQFQARTWANKLNLKCKLHNLKLEENKSVQEHLKAMTEIFDELAVIGYPVEEEDRAVQMLASLPESYSMIKTAFEASPEVPKLAVLTEKLINEERKIKEKRKTVQMRESTSNVLFAGANFAGASSRQKVCFYCGKTGHIKRFCDEWLKKCESENKEKPTAVANMCYRNNRNKTQFDSESSDDECIALVSEISENKNTRTLDSAASRHMCNDRRKFQGMTRLNEEVQIKVGDGSIVKAKYEGTVKLRIKAINQVRKFKLKKVLFVPDLKYNLLSVSQASESGKSIQFDKNGAQIKDLITKETVGTATRKGMLYHVNTVTTGEKIRPRTKRENQNKDMEIAFLCMKENNFKEEIMKRLDRIEEDRLILNERMNTVEEDITSPNYTLIKEENFQNEDDMKCIQKNTRKEYQFEDDQISILTIIQEDNIKENQENSEDSQVKEDDTSDDGRVVVSQIYTDQGDKGDSNYDFDYQGFFQINASQEDIGSHSEIEIKSALSVTSLEATDEQSLCSSVIDVKDLSIQGNPSMRKKMKNRLVV